MAARHLVPARSFPCNKETTMPHVSYRLGLVCPLLLLAPLAAQSSVTTMFLAGNSLNAPGTNMFDITVLNPSGIVITSFDVNCENTRNGGIGTPFDIQVFITARGGTYLGNESNPAAWTQVSGGQGMSMVQNTPTPVNVTDFFLPAGTFGMAIYYMTSPGLGTAFAYTNGTGTNQAFGNADLQLSLGCSNSLLFGPTTYTPRVWNGTIYYEASTRAAYGTYGTGCTGGSSNGAPVLAPGTANPVPRIGGPFDLQASNLGTTPDLGFLILGLQFQTWGPWPLPNDLALFGLPGCNAYIPPDAILSFVHIGGGSATITLGIPNNAGLAGMVLGTQALMLDPLATNPLHGNISNLAAGRVGT
jgi:hypothetical protein